MLKVILPRHILDWMLKFKGGLSLPVLIIHCVAYIKDNNITIEELTKERNPHQERGENERTKEPYREGENKYIS